MRCAVSADRPVRSGIGKPYLPSSRQAAERHGRLREQYDADHGILHITGSGLWDEPMVQQHFDRSYILIAQMIERGEPVLILVDLRDAHVQSDAVMAIVMKRTQPLYALADHVAHVVPLEVPEFRESDPGKPERSRYFGAREPAIAWLSEVRSAKAE
jgi:hypothetical protein